MGLINLARIAALYGHLRRALDRPALLAEARWWGELFVKAWRVQEVREMMAKLQGYKTYLIAALSAVLTLLKSLGKIDEATYQTLMALLGSGAVATVAAKINRMAR